MNNLDALNERYQELSIEERLSSLYDDFSSVLVTSSFGTTSAVMLKLLSEVNPDQEIIFINTRYLFKDTIDYMHDLRSLLDLNIKEIFPDDQQHEYSRANELWKTDPDLCCTVNKTTPLDMIRNNYQVWVSGIMHWQTPHRKKKQIFEHGNGILRFHPLVDLNEDQAKSIMNDLPQHPLEKAGFNSVGCYHCTIKGKGREGRWANSFKNECGLHVG